MTSKVLAATIQSVNHITYSLAFFKLENNAFQLIDVPKLPKPEEMPHIDASKEATTSSLKGNSLCHMSLYLLVFHSFTLPSLPRSQILMLYQYI